MRKTLNKAALSQTTEEYASRSSIHGIGYIFDKELHLLEGKSPQNGTERVSVTSAKTFFPLKDWAKMKSESSIIYVTMEKKHSGQAPTLGL